MLRADVLEQRVVDVAGDERLLGRGVPPLLGLGRLGNFAVQRLTEVVLLVPPSLVFNPLRLLRGQRAALALEVHRTLLVVAVDYPSRDVLAHRDFVLQPVHGIVGEVGFRDVAHDAALELHQHVTLGTLLPSRGDQPLDDAVHNLTRG